MGGMTHFKGVLKDEFLARLDGLGRHLRPEDILAWYTGATTFT
jgi:hypothetical protein